MKLIPIRLIFVITTIFLLAQSSPPAKTSIAVYPLKAVEGVDKSIAATLTSLMGYQLTQSSRLIVIKEDMLQEVMKRQAVNISDLCDSTMCQVEIGKLVQAQKMVTGELSKLGKLYILTTNVIDIQTGANEFSSLDQCACSEDQLIDLAGAASAKVRNHYGEAIPVPSLPQALGARVTSPAQPVAQQTFQEFHPPGAKGGPMVFVSDFKFYIDKYEVTNKDYDECVAAGACKQLKKKAGFDAPKQPVVFVNQEEARTYCQWAGKRLPKELEWQEAAQGTDGRIYPWGNKPPRCNLANYGDCGVKAILAVGSKPAGASPYGALDMAGNAWEWVEEKGVLRGGGWFNNASYLRGSSSLYSEFAWDRSNNLGFRCGGD